MIGRNVWREIRGANRLKRVESIIPSAVSLNQNRENAAPNTTGLIDTRGNLAHGGGGYVQTFLFVRKPRDTEDGSGRQKQKNGRENIFLHPSPPWHLRLNFSKGFQPLRIAYFQVF